MTFKSFAAVTWSSAQGALWLYFAPILGAIPIVQRIVSALSASQLGWEWDTLLKELAEHKSNLQKQLALERKILGRLTPLNAYENKISELSNRLTVLEAAQRRTTRVAVSPWSKGAFEADRAVHRRYLARTWLTALSPDQPTCTLYQPGSVSYIALLEHYSSLIRTESKSAAATMLEPVFAPRQRGTPSPSEQQCVELAISLLLAGEPEEAYRTLQLLLPEVARR